MRISQSNMMSNVNSVHKSSSRLGKIHEKLATGKKINRASDNAAMLAMAKELESQVRGFKQSDSNIGDALSALRIAEGTGNEVNSMLQRQRELTLQASNGTLNANDREALNTEYQALNEEIGRISKASNFNGMNLGSGDSQLSDGNGQIQDGPGADNQRNIGRIDYTQTMPTGDLLSPGNALNALNSIDSAIEETTKTRVGIGVEMNVMEHAQENNRNAEINTANALSMAEDLDYAKGATEMAQANILSQSSTRALGNFNQVHQANMSALLS